MRGIRNTVVALGLLAMSTTAVSAAASAPAAPEAKTSSACATETVGLGHPPTEQTLRFVLIGNVSCDKAHHLIRAYYKEVNKGRRCEGVHCLIDFRGGWTCSFLPATTSAELGGAVVSCFQAKTGAKVRTYEV